MGGARESLSKNSGIERAQPIGRRKPPIFVASIKNGGSRRPMGYARSEFEFLFI
jgi:hypothetical protein